MIHQKLNNKTCFLEFVYWLLFLYNIYCILSIVQVIESSESLENKGEVKEEEKAKEEELNNEVIEQADIVEEECVLKVVEDEEKPSEESSDENPHQAQHGTPQKYVTEYKTTTSASSSLNRGMLSYLVCFLGKCESNYPILFVIFSPFFTI